MKIALKKSIKDEKGQALILVMILMLVGGLIIMALLSFMSTGLIVGRVFEGKMAQVYAADAGVEDAIYKILSGNTSLPENVGDTWPYSIADVNDKDVGVEIVLEEDVEEFLDNLLEENYSGVHGDWAVVEETVGAGTYLITIIYSGNAQKKFIDGIGAWLQGVNAYESASGLIDDYQNYSPNPFMPIQYRGGTAFIWEWQGGDRPEFGTTSGVFERSLTFQFDPDQEPSIHFSWAVIGSANVGVIAGGQTFGIWKVIATATDSTTGKQTEVIAYVARQGETASYPVSILTWEIS